MHPINKQMSTLLVFRTPLKSNKVPIVSGMVLSIDCNFRIRSVVDEMPDMVVRVKSWLVWDLVSKVENSVLLHRDPSIPAISQTESVHMFLESFSTTTSDEFNAPLKSIDVHV